MPHPEPAVGEGREAHRSGAIPLHLLLPHCLICVASGPVTRPSFSACPELSKDRKRQAEQALADERTPTQTELFSSAIILRL
jgi:hypothetical protein